MTSLVLSSSTTYFIFLNWGEFSLGVWGEFWDSTGDNRTCLQGGRPWPKELTPSESHCPRPWEPALPEECLALWPPSGTFTKHQKEKGCSRRHPGFRHKHTSLPISYSNFQHSHTGPAFKVRPQYLCSCLFPCQDCQPPSWLFNHSHMFSICYNSVRAFFQVFPFSLCDLPRSGSLSSICGAETEVRLRPYSLWVRLGSNPGLWILTPPLIRWVSLYLSLLIWKMGIRIVSAS